MCYDPYYARMLQSIRQCLSDGHPVLVRLHSAADYPAATMTAYQNDLEGHVVMIVAYDDTRRLLGIWDPWDKRSGGERGEFSWMPASELAAIVQDSSRDCYIVPAPLEVNARVEDGTLKVEVGFYPVEGIVMDRDSLFLSDISVELGRTKDLSFAEGSSAKISGQWKVGENAVLEFPLVESEASAASLVIEVSATVRGVRPYPFQDSIRTTASRRVSLKQQAAFAVA